MRRAAALLILGAAIVAASPGVSHSWGARTHEIINRRAIDRLPEPARAAWAPLAAALGAHANDADGRKSTSADEPSRHFFDIDVYGEPPFDDVPRDRRALEKRRGAEAVARYGVAPWAIEECYRALVASVGRGDWSSAGAWAADLGHYVGDTHQPLHCTKNFDGQNTGNEGIHLRFEITMMDRHFDESMLGESGDPAPIPQGVVEACFDWVAHAHPGVEPILAADRAARSVDPGFGDAYYAALWQESKHVAVVQVDRAVRDLSSVLHAAWLEAGSPEPPSEAPPFHATPVQEPPASSSGRAVGVPVIATALGVVLAALLVASF